VDLEEISVQLVSLFGKTGAPSYWADPASSRIFDPTGQAVGFINFDSIFDRYGNHIGWWHCATTFAIMSVGCCWLCVVLRLLE
jgi:hypothetical protein